VARFGAKFDAQGVLAGSKDSGRCIRYLTKYLTKHIAGCDTADTPAQEQHAARLLDALRYEPCSPTCGNWLRYGIKAKTEPLLQTVATEAVSAILETGVSGAPGRIRTCDRLLRRQLLCPAELQAPGLQFCTAKVTRLQRSG
jgi:hypothetical protein